MSFRDHLETCTFCKAAGITVTVTSVLNLKSPNLFLYRSPKNGLKTCGYCQNQKENDHKAKLVELGHMIRGTRPIPATKGASSSSDSHSRLTLRYHPTQARNKRSSENLVYRLEAFRVIASI
jgi:hypothetical protein